MQLTKHGHACVRLTKDDGGVLVVDPGTFTDPAVLAGADAVLVTHEHVDHLAPEVLRQALDASPGLQVWCNAAVAQQLDGPAGRVHLVGHEDALTAAGFDVTVHGEWHAVIHPDIPRITNVGYLVDGTVFHPGDALTVPGVPVDALLVPVHAPWSRTGELVDWVREVAPAQTLSVHDGLLNAVGLGGVGRMLGEGGPGTGAPIRMLAVGEQVTLA